jgi:hypothetical protein
MAAVLIAHLRWALPIFLLDFPAHLPAGNRLTSKLGSDKLGDAIGTNQMRFTFNTFDKHGNSTTRISNKIVPIRDGWQLSDFKVTGILQTSEI